MEEKESCGIMAIDLKSFYASCECVERGLDSMDAYLVVADGGRTEKTICLAVSPALKNFGIPGRPRLFEVIERVKEINYQRKRKTEERRLVGSSCLDSDLKSYSFLALSYITAPPRMALYMEYSRRIYEIYLRFVSREDIHVYSVDEVFIDLRPYEKVYRKSAEELAAEIARTVYGEMRIVATVGLGENLYLAKVAMDILAKHLKTTEDGLRLAKLTERSYRRELWEYRPIRDFWRIGRGTAEKLESYGIYTMGDIALASLSGEEKKQNQALLYKLFGIQAEYLIDHAWGYEPCRIADIHALQAKRKSLSSGQVLPCPYDFQKGRIVAEEMAEALAYELKEKGLCTELVQLSLSFDGENVGESYAGEKRKNHYGKLVPRGVHGLRHLMERSNREKDITEAILSIYDEIMDRRLSIRKLSLSFEDISPVKKEKLGQVDLFTYCREKEENEKKEEGCGKGILQESFPDREERVREASLQLMQKYGKNAVLKAYQYLDEARGRERNKQIGGHSSGI